MVLTTPSDALSPTAVPGATCLALLALGGPVLTVPETEAAAPVNAAGRPGGPGEDRFAGTD